MNPTPDLPRANSDTATQEGRNSRAARIRPRRAGGPATAAKVRLVHGRTAERSAGFRSAKTASTFAD